jgi:hypothetical protein
MTNEITISKQEFALALTAEGLNVVSYIPERITPPIVVIAAGSPYLVTSTIAVGEFLMNLEVTLIASKATNKQETEYLDSLIEDFLLALPGYAKLGSVGSPFELATGNASYLASTVNLDIQITI